MFSFIALLVLLSTCQANLWSKYTDENEAQGLPSVIIVGAGAAGVAAAARLLDNGFSNIVILEAEDRIGGRIHSVQFGDTVVDLGAEYCHGQEGNVVYEMVKDLDVLTYSPFVEAIDLYYSNGSKIGGQLKTDWSHFLLGYAGIITAGTFFPKDQLIDAPVLSLGEALTKSFDDTFLEKYRDDKAGTKVLQEALRTLEYLVLSVTGSFSWLEPSAENDYEDSDGDQEMSFVGYGYKTVLEELLKSFPNPDRRLPIGDKILLKKKVTKITWNSSNTGVLVECSDKSSYRANHVIFTPSIGVLKHDHSKIFSPKLPKEKQEAISCIGFGGVMKIVLHFSVGWWDRDFDHSSFIWSSEDLKDLKNYNTDIFWLDSVAFVASSIKTNTVTIWITGTKVPNIENLPKKILLKGSMYFLQRFLGSKYNIGAPDNILHSSWYSNANFRGAYSFETVESVRKKQTNQKDLAEPLERNGLPVVLFAGEASSPVHFGTVHGAIETGRREADRIIKLLESTAVCTYNIKEELRKIEDQRFSIFNY